MATAQYQPLYGTLPLMKRATIQDVARACGVAKSTVSAVLNNSLGSQRVAEQTRQRVRMVAEQMAYRPSWRGRALAGKRTHVVGVLYTPPMPLIARGNYEGILSGINDVLQVRGYHLMLMPLGDNPLEWRAMLLDGRMDGAIVLSRLVPQLAEIIAEVKLPISLVNAETDADVARVVADDYQGSREMTEYLLSLGHRRIAYLQGDQPPHYSIDQRRGAYEDVMRAAGLGEEIRVQTRGNAVDFGAAFAAQPTDRRPTAVLCYTHYLAIKLLQVLWERQLQVPRDLSVACFSNSYPVADVIPPLTTIALATEQMGRTAAELVLEQIDSRGKTPRRRLALRTQLIVRQSTAAPVATG
jgi:DNA-binding LacI/PurR family transcriptional regulator